MRCRCAGRLWGCASFAADPSSGAPCHRADTFPLMICTVSRGFQPLLFSSSRIASPVASAAAQVCCVDSGGIFPAYPERPSPLLSPSCHLVDLLVCILSNHPGACLQTLRRSSKCAFQPRQPQKRPFARPQRCFLSRAIVAAMAPQEGLVTSEPVRSVEQGCLAAFSRNTRNGCLQGQTTTASPLTAAGHK